MRVRQEEVGITSQKERGPTRAPENLSSPRFSNSAWPGQVNSFVRGG